MACAPADARTNEPRPPPGGGQHLGSSAPDPDWNHPVKRPFGLPTAAVGHTLLPWSLALLMCWAGAAAAFIPCANVTPAGGSAGDFTIVKRASVYHVFHTLRSGDEVNCLGHETSTDLYHWTTRADVLIGTQASAPGTPDGRNGWNRDLVWAPSIVLSNGTYYMFYTGGRRRPSASSCPGQIYQELGVATSTDLYTWRLELDPWLVPGKVPWALQDTCSYDFGNFRDPFVTRDPATGGWLMYYTTIPSAAAVAANVGCTSACSGGCGYSSSRFVLGVARAPSGFTHAADWTDLKPLWQTYQTYPGSACYRTWESPHVFKRTWNGSDLWYLLASAGTGLYATDLVIMTSAVAPTADPSAWTFRGRLDEQHICDPYGNQLALYESYGWVASEYFQDPDDGREYLANCTGYPIQIRQILWRSSGDGFDLVEPFHVLAVTPDRSSAISGTTVNLTFSGRNCVDAIGPRTVPIEVVRLDEDGNPLGLVPTSAIGLPATVTLTEDQTVLRWACREWPLGHVLNLRVRLKDKSTGISSPIITVRPVAGGGGRRPRMLPDGVAADPGVERETDAAPAAPEFGLRVQGAASAADGVDLRIELPAAQRARLDVYDLGGRRVRELAARVLPAGPSVMHWDLNGADGRRAAAGVYFARLVTAEDARTARIVVPSGR